MEQDWSLRKKLFFWLAFIAVVVVILTITDVFDFQPMDNLYVKIVIYVILGLFGLMAIYAGVWIAVMFPYAIVKDIKEKRRVTDAKWAAYGILDEFGTVRLKKRISHYKLKRLKEIEEIMEILSKKHEDREARHLLNDLYKLEYELEQVPDNEEDEEEEEEEEEDDDKDSLLKAMSISELETMKETYKGNPSVVKILDGYIEAKRKATKEF